MPSPASRDALPAIPAANVRAHRRLAAMEAARATAQKAFADAIAMIEQRRLADDDGDKARSTSSEIASAQLVVVSTIAEPLAALGWFLDWARDA